MTILIRGTALTSAKKTASSSVDSENVTNTPPYRRNGVIYEPSDGMLTRRQVHVYADTRYASFSQFFLIMSPFAIAPRQCGLLL